MFNYITIVQTVWIVSMSAISPDLQVCVNMSMRDTSASEPKGEEDAGETISNLLITSNYN